MTAHFYLCQVYSLANDCMWCRRCQQAVMMEASDDAEHGLCPRCGTPAFHETAPFSELENWELDQQLRHVASLLTSAPPGSLEEYLRLDQAHRLYAGSSAEESPRTPRAAEERTLGGHCKGALSSLSIALGMGACVCGAMLSAWAGFGGRADLWIPAAAATLVGQIALLWGWVLRPAIVAPPLEVTQRRLHVSRDRRSLDRGQV